MEYREKKQLIREKKLMQMKQKRERREKQAVDKERKKDNLDGKMNKCGGLWHSEDDLQRNTAELNEKEKKDAIITQIKYRKVVLGTTVGDKKLLQITSN